MSITDPRFDSSSLAPYSGQLGLDDLQRRHDALGQVGVEALREAEVAPAAPATDPGEDVLAAPAWDGAPGTRLFHADAALGAELAGLPLAAAAERAADAIFAALG
ncbi:hypothetical protein [Coralloluteibacterium thermophilus]|uniref:Uncharacterized protein n=1 Tax=Coralloluteibacterium thermophilum TaxID=2707049 RepID=A0ABV9NK92_9GAMM